MTKTLVFFSFYSEIFVKDATVALTLTEEIEDLKYYIRTCPYNARIAMFLGHLFNLKGQSECIRYDIFKELQLRLEIVLWI